MSQNKREQWQSPALSVVSGVGVSESGGATFPIENGLSAPSGPN